jgi:hypothetical protein
MNMVEQARTMPRTNDRDGHSAPTARFYPFSWNGESALVAMGSATRDDARGAGDRIATATVVGRRDNSPHRVPHLIRRLAPATHGLLGHRVDHGAYCIAQTLVQATR